MIAAYLLYGSRTDTGLLIVLFTRPALISVSCIKPPYAVIVGEEAHERLRALDLFLRQPSGVLDGLPDVLGFQVRVIVQNLTVGRTVGDLADDHRDWNPHPPNASSPSHNVGVEGDAVEHAGGLHCVL